MGKILVLDELTTCKIAAGEVVERPASVVKEMVDNSIDAGATRINIEIRNGGIKYIKIEDNGQGFMQDDVVIAFDKHATSKIACAEDIESVTTLGFRGEALASIAAVSKTTLKTKTEDAPNGIFVVFEGGELIDSGSCGAKKGSAFVVENLFFNTPARYKFLKKDQTEAAYVCDVVEKAALSHPNVSFTLISDKKQVLYTPGNGDMLSAIYGIFGKDFTQFLKKVTYNQGSIVINGYVGTRELTYGNRNRQLTFVNGRFIKNKTILSAVDEAYKTLVMRGKFPCVLLDISISPSQVDQNVSPSKTEVRFQDDNAVFKAVYNTITGGLFANFESYTETQINQPVVKPVMQTSLQFAPKPAPELAPELAEKPYIKPAIEPAQEQILPEINKILPETSKYEIPTITEPKRQEVHEAEPISLENYGIKYPENDNKASFKREKLPRNIVGQLFETYILLEEGNTFLMIDQHAAHERIMYEKIKKALLEHTNDQQVLLQPISVSLSASEFAKFKDCKENLESLGFEVEEFGINTLIIRAIPMMLEGVDPENFLVGAITDANIKEKNTINVFSDNAVYTMACKAAIKANHTMTIQEINGLLDELDEIPDLNTCPHGRPIMLKISKYEIERKFHRA